MPERTPSLSAWSGFMAVIWVLIILDWTDVWHAWTWLYIGLLAAYVIGLFWRYGPGPRASWRMTDSRTTEGDKRS